MVLLFLLLNLYAFANEPLSCSDFYTSDLDVSASVNINPDNFSPICKQWFNNKSPYVEKFKDGSALPNFRVILENTRSGRPTAVLNPTIIQEHKVQELFTNLKRTAKAGVRRSQASAANKLFLVERLNSLKLKYFPRNYPCGSDPDPKYVPSENTVYVCKGGLSLTLESLIPVLSHEIGHSLDPCTSIIYKYTAKMKSAIARGDVQAFNRCGLRSSAFEDVKDSLREGQSGMPIDLQNYASAEMLVKCGLLSSPSPYPSNFEGSFGASMRSCSSTTYRNEEPLTIPHVLNQCHSKSLESFAENIGAEITANYLQADRNALRKGYGHTLMYYYVEANCRNGSFEGSSYPNRKERLLTYLQYPEVQRALGCQGIKTQPVCAISDYFPQANGKTILK